MDLVLIAKILSVVLVISEALAALQTLLWPANAGFGGILAGIIKALKAMGAKEPPVA